MCPVWCPLQRRGRTQLRPDLPKLVRIVKDWSKQDVYASDPEAADFCIDIHEGELLVVTRKGTHGYDPCPAAGHHRTVRLPQRAVASRLMRRGRRWIFGRVVGKPNGESTEDGREGWFPPSFCVVARTQDNQSGRCREGLDVPGGHIGVGIILAGLSPSWWKTA